MHCCHGNAFPGELPAGHVELLHVELLLKLHLATEAMSTAKSTAPHVELLHVELLPKLDSGNEGKVNGKVNGKQSERRATTRRATT